MMPVDFKPMASTSAKIILSLKQVISHTLYLVGMLAPPCELDKLLVQCACIFT